MVDNCRFAGEHEIAVGVARLLQQEPLQGGQGAAKALQTEPAAAELAEYGVHHRIATGELAAVAVPPYPHDALFVPPLDLAQGETGGAG